jgi:nucleoside-diphosphate-sugar epimerase
MVEAAERAGVERFVFFSALSASAHNRTRFLRAKALAEEAVRDSSIAHTVFAPSIIYAPGDPYLTLLNRLALLPVMPLSGAGRAQYQPIWAHDVAECVMAALEAGANADERYAGIVVVTPDFDAELEALHARFRDHTNALFVKHGMTVVGYWVPSDAESAVFGSKVATSQSASPLVAQSSPRSPFSQTFIPLRSTFP